MNTGIYGNFQICISLPSMVIQVMLYALIKNTNTGISELLVNALNLQCLHSLWKCTDADQLKQKSKFLH